MGLRRLDTARVVDDMSAVNTGVNLEVTVLMSCYNASRWLHEAIDSVLSQTFKKFELIVVDDGSTDHTRSVIEHYCNLDRRVVAISKKNTGLADSLNVGIAHAKGAWIARLDADDLCEERRLDEQLAFVRQYPDVVLLGSGFVEIDEHKQVIKEHSYPSTHRTLVRHLERLQRMFPHSSAFFKRETAEAAGCYNPFFKKTQDWDLWLRLAERGKLASLKRCLVRVRKHSEQIQKSPGTAQLVYGAAASACHFLRLRGLPDPSSSEDDMIWEEFLAWIDKRMTEEGVVERQKAWADARANYFAQKNGMGNTLRFCMRVVRSGHVTQILAERIFSSAMAEHLAQEWMNQVCAAS